MMFRQKTEEPCVLFEGGIFAIDMVREHIRCHTDLGAIDDKQTRIARRTYLKDMEAFIIDHLPLVSE